MNPNNSESYKFKSIALWNLSGPKEAIKNIEEAILLDPKNADLIHQKSCFLMDERKYEESLTEIEEALRINSRDPNILNTKSLCLSLKQCHSQALDTIRKAISVESSSKQFLLIANCGIVLARAGKHLEAVSTCNSVIETNPSDEAGYYGIACCYALQGNYGMALASLQEAVNINSMRCRREARKNPDFDRLRNDEHFILMTTERTSTS